MQINRFKTSFAHRIFQQKYAQGPNDSWDALAERLVEDVCGTRWGTERALMSDSDRKQLVEYIKTMAFLPGGRYLYYSGRPNHYFNNCFLLRGEEDTREEWGELVKRATNCLMTGGGIGVDYSRFRASGKPLSRTGGISSGPLPLANAINEIGRSVMQGGSRRSAIYASLNWLHEDIPLFMKIKNWSDDVKFMKEKDFNFPANLDMTNISINYDNKWKYNADRANLHTFVENCRQAMMTGEPGFSFNFDEKENETLRNAPLGGNTHVLTKTGYVPIKEIVNQEVSVWTGKQWAPTTFKLTKEYADTVRVEISGGRHIIAEPSHEFFLTNGSKVAAGNLQSQDELLVSMPNPKPFSQNPKGYTLGYIYGDGSFHKKYPRAEITFCTDESKSCVDALDQSMVSSITWNDSRGYTRVYTKNDSILSKRSKEVFPYDIMDGGTDFLCSFIAGLFDSDGNYFEKQNRVRVASKHYDFLVGVRHCLEQLGILSGISTAGTSTYGNNQGYSLTIYGTYVQRFAEIIPTKRLKVKDFEPYRISKLKVLGVFPDEKQDVFCCDVGVEEHAFMAEGVIVSNCTEVTSEDDSDVCNLGSINLGNNLWRSSKISSNSVQGFLSAEPLEQIYLTKKYIKYGKRIGDWGLDSWEFTNGS